MDFVDVLKVKNNITLKKWPTLPDAFKNTEMEKVVAGLIEEGWEVYDVVVAGTPVHLARKTINEIFFDNHQAVFASSDYGEFQGRTFELNISGSYKTHKAPERYWCAV